VFANRVHGKAYPRSETQITSLSEKRVGSLRFQPADQVWSDCRAKRNRCGGCHKLSSIQLFDFAAIFLVKADHFFGHHFAFVGSKGPRFGRSTFFDISCRFFGQVGNKYLSDKLRFIKLASQLSPRRIESRIASKRSDGVEHSVRSIWQAKQTR